MSYEQTTALECCLLWSSLRLFFLLLVPVIKGSGWIEHELPSAGTSRYFGNVNGDSEAGISFLIPFLRLSQFFFFFFPRRTQCEV